MIDRVEMYPIKLNNKLDKHKYIVDSNDGSQGYYNKKVDGTTDFVWNVSYSLVTIFNKTDERIHSLHEYTKTIIINRFPWIGEAYDLLISLMTKNKEDETKRKEDIFALDLSIEGSGNVNDRTVLANMATSYSGINSSYGGCMKVYFEQQPFIYEDIRMRMW